MDIRAAAMLINSAQRKESDPPIIYILDCTSCGEAYGRLPQDVALAERKDSLQLCNLCQDEQRKIQKSSRQYERRNGKLKWSDSLGIAYPKKGTNKSDGPYSEIMHRFEIWLRDVHNYKSGDEIAWETRGDMQKRFFAEFVEEPNLFSSQKIVKRNRDGHDIYVCTGCQAQLSPNYFIKCCPSKKPREVLF